MPNVLLGNPAPMMQVDRHGVAEDGETVVTDRVGVRAAHLNQAVTRVEMRPDFDDPDHVELTLSTNNDRALMRLARALGDLHRNYTIGVYEVDHLWGVHCESGDPAWVSCPDDPDFEAALAEHFDCARGEPVALLTNLGRDDLHGSHLSLTQPAGHTFMGVSANATAASAATVTLPGEITTAGGTLIRKAATMAHTSGTNTTTATATFTANGTDSVPVVIAKMGMHNALTGTSKCGYETLLNATATITISGDSTTITETVTAG